MADIKSLEKVTIHFAGDSGDGIQLAGGQFTHTTALAGNDLSTFPDFPAEIRAPVGTVAGVSGFQINFGRVEISTPGSNPDVLVVMNAAAFKKNFPNLKRGGTLIANESGFDKRNLRLAKMPEDENPLDALADTDYELHRIDITGLNRKALEDLSLPNREKDRSKNLFALGFVYWLYNRSLDHTLGFLSEKFSGQPEILEANVRALKAGYNYGITIEAPTRYRVEKADQSPGEYRGIVGNEALGLGLIAAAQQAELPLFYAGYPITPASDILHFLSRHKNFGVKTFQAEDEIAAATAAIGAAFGGALAVTATSGPGMALKTESLGLAVMLELPLLVINVQRGGPSTGLPTKTEQADLMQAVYGRSGEAPLPVIAASSPSDCFETAMEAARLALAHMTPVILLSDGYIANGAEPWKFPRAANLPRLNHHIVTEGSGDFQPYQRNENLVRSWALPGTPGLEHRIGGLEKEDVTGNVNYGPENHEKMVRLRAEKIDRVKESYPPLQIDLGPATGDLLVIGWGSTRGTIREAVAEARAEGHSVAQLHLRHLFPFADELGKILRGYRQILVPEINNGQLVHLLRQHYDASFTSFTKIQGRPLRVIDLLEAIRSAIPQKA